MSTCMVNIWKCILIKFINLHPNHCKVRWATRQRWVTSLANCNFKIFYRSGKLNVEADALSQIPWDYMEPAIVKV